MSVKAPRPRRLTRNSQPDPYELRFIGVREVVTLTLKQTWDGRAFDMIAAGRKKAAELARQF
jgi:hypothetical protein